MRHLATYMLLVLGGKASPTKEDVTTALSAVGMDVSRHPVLRDNLRPLTASHPLVHAITSVVDINRLASRPLIKTPIPLLAEQIEQK